MDKRLKNKFRNIKLLALDFDGVMTDGFVYVDQNGKETVRCSRRDGFGIGLLRKHGIASGVLSTEKNPVVRARCLKLGISYWQGLELGSDKLAVLKRVLKNAHLAPAVVAYMGDDLNDIAVMRYVGLPIAVSDAHRAVKKAAVYVTRAAGGNHAVREIIELMLQAKGIAIKT